MDTAADWVKAAWSLVGQPVKLLLPPLVFIAVLGLIFNTMLARSLGFDSPDTFVIGDQIASGLLLLVPTLKQLVLLTLSVGAAAATVVLVLLAGDAWFRLSVWLRHASIRLRARTYRQWASRLQQLSFKGDWAWLDPPCQWLRRSLRRRSNRRYRDARALRAEHGFIEQRRFGLDGVWRALVADMRAAFARSWQWIAGGSAYAVVAILAVSGLFAAHIAVDTAADYVGKIRQYTENSLGKVAAGTSAPTAVIGSASAAAGGGTGPVGAGAAPPSTASSTFYPLTMLRSLEGAVNHAGQRPRLVSLLLKDQTAYLRPMMLVAEFDDELVLYDFFGDDDPEDERLFPIRTVDPANVAMMLSAVASTPLAGVAPQKSAARGIIEAGCIEPGGVEAEPPAADVAAVVKPAGMPVGPAVAPPADAPAGSAVAAEAPALAPIPAAFRPWRDEWAEIRTTLIKGDGVDCRTGSAEPPADKPLVIDIGDRLAARLAGVEETPLKAAGSITEQLAGINVALGAVADRIAAGTPDSGIDPAIAESLGRLGESLAELAEAVRDKPIPEPPEPSPPVYNTTNYFITRVDRDGVTATFKGRWDDCRELAAWSGSGIRFANGRFGLAGPTRNDLELGNGAADPAAAWQRLLTIFSTWSAEAGRAVAEADGRMPFVVLIGRATERGRPGLNLELTEDRAAAVKAALLSTAAQTRWVDTGIEPDRIIAIGEGETALVPGEIPTDGMTRRVDAKVCFG